MKNSPFLKLIQCVVLCLLAFTIVPERIFAQEAVACMKDDSGNITELYYSIPDAMNGSRKGAIHMLTDWDLGAQINIVEGTKSTIYMDGHIIKKTNGKQSDDSEGGIFTIHPNAELFLYGSTDKKELTDSKGNTVNSGGLVTGGYAFHGGAVYMKKGAKLHLTNVAISGNKSDYRGGAIFIAKENCYIWMNDGHIDHNWSGTSGGGIYSDADGTHIYMDNHSTINYNQANDTGSYGGGVAFYYSWFSIEGDGTSEVSYNKIIPSKYGAGCYGGGISTTEKKLATNYGIISGLTINGNEAGCGGGVDINPRNTVLKDVVITNNVAREEGGGVYVLYDVDVTLSGKVIIKDNKRGDSNSTNYDDISLGTCFGIEAYILLDNLSSDSLIGIRTGTVNKDRLVAKNVSDSSLLSCFFMDLNHSYHVGYQSSNKEIWQRTGVATYAAKVNDKTIGGFSEGTRNITVVDNNTDSSRVFASWQANNAVKLSAEQLNSDVISFTMPAAEVNLRANYITAAKDISLKVDELKIGESFPSKANIIWTFDYSCTMPVDIKWYKNTNTGYKEVEANETVQEGVAYKFETIINKKLDNNLKLAFSKNLESKDVKVYYNGSQIDIDSFSLNDKGTLSLTSGSIVAGSDELAYVTPIVVSVDEGISKDELISLINNSYKQTSATSINNKDYDVNIIDVNENTFNADMFDDENKLKRNDQGYVRIDDVALDGCDDITTSIIINVSSIADVYRLTDEYEQDETNWYKTITLSGAWYRLDDNLRQQCYSNTCEIRLNGIKGQKVEHNFTVWQMDDYTYEPSDYADYRYILDNSKIDAPKFNEATKSSDDNGSSLTVSAYTNLGTIYYLYNDGTNNWAISKDNSITFTNSEEAYKTYKVLSWSSNDTNASGVSDSKYSIDNTKGIIGVNQIEIAMDLPTLNQKFPTVINSIKACLNERTVDIANNVSITSWYPEHKSDTVDKECYYMANIKLDNLDQSSIDLLQKYDIKVVDSSNTYSYVDTQDGVSYLHIIFIKKVSFNNVNSNTNNDVDNDNKDADRTVASNPTCEEYMKSNDWTWSETKQKCVYRVSNTSVQ